MTAAFSDRAPKRRSFRVRTIARKLSFSASSASTIATRRAGSEGISSGRIGMLQSYRIGAHFTIHINQFTPPEEAFAPVAERPSSNRALRANISTNPPTDEGDGPALASVTVEDPHHPLFGRSFRVLGFAPPSTVGLSPSYEVKYLHGISLLVPVAATVRPDRLEKRTKLSVEALRDLISLIAISATLPSTVTRIGPAASL